MKKILMVITVCLLVVAMKTVEASEVVGPSDNLSQSELSFDNIGNLTSPPTFEQQEKLKAYYQKLDQKIFNPTFLKKLYEKNQEEIKAYLQERTADKKVYFKELVRTAASYREQDEFPESLGTYGDVLVTYSISSIGWDYFITGHAAIVHKDRQTTIESMPYWFDKDKPDGVWFYHNNWKERKKVIGLRIKNASGEDYRKAAEYATDQGNQRKRYNLNFLDKGTTESFYCSQLVWRAWINQGHDIDQYNLGDYDPVTPAELVGGKNVYVFYRKD